MNFGLEYSYNLDNDKWDIILLDRNTGKSKAFEVGNVAIGGVKALETLKENLEEFING